MKGDDFISPAGRPPKENPRNVNLNIRITKDEAQRIQSCADELRVTRTDAIMKGIGLVEKELEKQKRVVTISFDRLVTTQDTTP